MGFASKMKKLHTVSYDCDVDVYKRNTVVIIEKGPPSLRRISVNGIKWWEVGNFIVYSAQLLIWFTGY